MKNNNLYVGYTIDLKTRLSEHNRGLSFSTNPDNPWQAIRHEAYRNEKDAKRREEYLKTGTTKDIKMYAKRIFL